MEHSNLSLSYYQNHKSICIRFVIRNTNTNGYYYINKLLGGYYDRLSNYNIYY